MATPTYDLLSTITTTSVVSSVTFTSFPTSYKDLVVVVNAKANQNDSFLGLRLNNDTGNNYNFVDFYYPSGYTQKSNHNKIQMHGRLIDTSWTAFSINIMDYREYYTHTPIMARYGDGDSGTGMTAGRWANAGRVTTINLFGGQGLQLAVGSTFKLYGIAG
jgi:hypothetical protein